MNIQDKRAGRSERGRVAEPKQQVAVTEIRACGGERGGSGEGIRAVDMQICVVHLLSEMVIVKNLVEFGEQASFSIGRRFIERIFFVEDELRGSRWVDEIQLPVFVKPFRGSEPECFVTHHGAAAGKVVVPAQEVRHALSGNVRTVERAVSMVGGGQAMNIVAAGLGDDVDDASGSMAELSLIACGDDLEFGDGVLIELRGCAAIEFVLVRQAINEEPRVVGALTEDGCGVVAVQVGLPVDRNSRNELHKIQVVSSVQRHVNDLLWSDGHSLR